MRTAERANDPLGVATAWMDWLIRSEEGGCEGELERAEAGAGGSCSLQGSCQCMPFSSRQYSFCPISNTRPSSRGDVFDGYGLVERLHVASRAISPQHISWQADTQTRHRDSRYYYQDLGCLGRTLVYLTSSSPHSTASQHHIINRC
jgi:hypothetical protein